MRIPAKKTLGQHFLLNPSTIDKILEIARVGASDQILEIGPGPGIMTRRLAGRAGRVVAVEKDGRFAEKLRTDLGSLKNLSVIEGDFLDIDIEKIVSEYRTDRALPVRQDGANKWKVVANLPYNIATEAIFHLLESRSLFASFHLMVQKEVADRLIARPGSKDYGILSVFTQLFSENKIVMTLPPGAFSPPPRVWSAVVSFRIAPECRFSIHHLPTFKSVVRAAFGQRRKMLSNALRNGLPNFSPATIRATLIAAGFPPSLRAERIPIEGFVKIANELTELVGVL